VSILAVDCKNRSLRHIGYYYIQPLLHPFLFPSLESSMLYFRLFSLFMLSTCTVTNDQIYNLSSWKIGRVIKIIFITIYRSWIFVCQCLFVRQSLSGISIRIYRVESQWQWEWEWEWQWNNLTFQVKGTASRED